MRSISESAVGAKKIFTVQKFMSLMEFQHCKRDLDELVRKIPDGEIVLEENIHQYLIQVLGATRKIAE